MTLILQIIIQDFYLVFSIQSDLHDSSLMKNSDSILNNFFQNCTTADPKYELCYQTFYWK